MPVSRVPSVRRRCTIPMLLLVLCGAGSALADGIDTLQLRDQFGAVDSLAAHRGAVVVAVVVDVRRLSTIQRWGEELGGRYPALHFLNIAQMPAEGPVDMARVTATLQKRVPATVPVLIDIERRWATSHRLDTAAPNLLVFDREGRLAGQLRGRFSAERAAAITPLIDRLLAQ
ncbi:MAG: hypothetical protein KJ040_05695 [Gammaproteobacteria bacterium]|nr:hypothetical protein [Gammaproteobacteria bacterium]